MVKRTFLQIDLQNLFYEARKRDEKIDFEKIWNSINSREGEFLTEAIVYLIRSQDFESDKFETKLQKWGYKIQAKNTYRVFMDTCPTCKAEIDKSRPFFRQTNLDVEIAVDCVNRINNYDKWILMSGDGDFAYPCRYLKQQGKTVEIWSFKECYNSSLDPDKVTFISEDFYYKKPKVSVFGFKRGPL